jgi:hypothetical protein
VSAKPTGCPQVVILPADDLQATVDTLESLAAALPDAPVHIARTGVPALDSVTDLLAGAGLSVVDVPAMAGLDGIVEALDRHFGTRPWCYLFGGEVFDGDEAAALAQGLQLRGEPLHRWLGDDSPLGRPRVRAAGRPRPAEQAILLSPFRPTGSWTYCLTRTTRSIFETYDQVYDDVCLLTNLGQYDAAFQRAALSWRLADGPARLHLVRALTVLSMFLSTEGSALEATAEWFALEPEPYVAIAYVRTGMGRISCELLERMLSMIPEGMGVTYAGGALNEPFEHIMVLRAHLARLRFSLTKERELLMRLAATGQAMAPDIGRLITITSLLSLPADEVVRALLPHYRPAPSLMFGDSINHDLDIDFLARLFGSLHEHYGRAAWVDRVVRRVLMIRDCDAALAFDEAGVDHFDHWQMIATQDWLTPAKRELAKQKLFERAERRRAANQAAAAVEGAA